jgi:hypothetical protein
MNGSSKIESHEEPALDDLNVNNYNIVELLTLINASNVPTIEEVTQLTDSLASQVHGSDVKTSMFFLDVQNTLIDHLRAMALPEEDVPNINMKTLQLEAQDIVGKQADDGVDVLRGGRETDKEIYANVPWEEPGWIQKSKRNFERVDYLPNIESDSDEDVASNGEEGGNVNGEEEDEDIVSNNEENGENNQEGFRGNASNVFHERRSGSKDTRLTFKVPVTQGNKNPLLKNTINRFVIIDSKYREISSGTTISSNDYLAVLSHPLTNVLSLRVYACQIQYCWYAFNQTIKNTGMWVSHTTYDSVTDVGSETIIPISIQEGNYSPQTLVAELISAFNRATFLSVSSSNISYSERTGKFTIDIAGQYCTGGTIPNPFYVNQTIDIVPFTVSLGTVLIFFNPLVSVTNTTYFDQTLGWRLGFREPTIVFTDGSGVVSTPINTTINVAGPVEGKAIADITGTKYLTLLIDDYNQNQIDGTITTIAAAATTVAVPSYYRPGAPVVAENPGTVNIQDVTGNSLLSGSLANTFAVAPIVQPFVNPVGNSLTENQIYAINEATRFNIKHSRYRTPAPSNSGVIAIIPVNTSDVPTGTVMSLFSEQMQTFAVRKYFGPVTIQKMRLKLLDDAGNTISLNGGDWSVSFIAESLYQY